MKRSLLALIAISLIVAFTGCANQYGRRAMRCSPESCPSGSESYASGDENACVEATDSGGCRLCRDHACRLARRGARGAEGNNSGPATGAVAYPYYTVRGPRDFLDRNPQSIGP
jgi:hypothetical protein